MSLEKVVKRIQEIVGFYVDVEYDEFINPSFGTGNRIDDVLTDDELYHPMFEPVDFLTNEHLHIYHVMLPTKLKEDLRAFNYFKKTLSKKGLILSNFTDLSVFTILHELGHAYHLYVELKGNIEEYISTFYFENQSIDYQIKENGFDFEKINDAHRLKATEIYADNYAIQHFEKVMSVLKQEDMLGLL